MNNFKVGVIAGTPIDTEMGVKFLKSKGIDAYAYPVSSCSQEQSELQILSPTELTDKIRVIIRKIKYEKINKVMVYCNSLSAAVDMDKLSIEENIKIITPLHVYKNIASKYKNIGVITANNKSAAGIENIVQNVNSECNVIGIGILPVVIDIENGVSPQKIVEKFSLKNIIEFYNSIQVDTLILGCTHLPYIYEELKKLASVPILDPAEDMYEMICS
ncbi:Asp/Glu/hydantoin racemase [Clostridium sp. MB40-C1]|uniref:Asp/Glu/hydantoin racemase n=1 Tax=Clostridium sp. MB40-C1 TaxID=3070996 RepID=UPI0027DEE069|nr:Asp/Glu/hydantoin racemase [Clostridium sp. MB40-C1]WMJ79246.1 Asp/Glu/hydantoin racemase [Clostridium sp. MB40-C1]